MPHCRLRDPWRNTQDYDEDRRLWYCDIEVRTQSYYPFIRLALARYQPMSVSGAHLSNIVLADIMPLAADRWLTVTETSGRGRRHVTVHGPRYTDSSGRREASMAPRKPSARSSRGTAGA